MHMEQESEEENQAVMGVTLAGASEGTPLDRNCNDIALQLQWPKGYVETSVAPTGVQIGARALRFEKKRTRFCHVSHSARPSDTGFKPGDYQKPQCIRYNFFFALFGVGIPC